MLDGLVDRRVFCAPTQWDRPRSLLPPTVAQQACGKEDGGERGGGELCQGLFRGEGGHALLCRVPRLRLGVPLRGLVLRGLQGLLQEEHPRYLQGYPSLTSFWVAPHSPPSLLSTCSPLRAHLFLLSVFVLHASQWTSSSALSIYTCNLLSVFSDNECKSIHLPIDQLLVDNDSCGVFSYFGC